VKKTSICRQTVSVYLFVVRQNNDWKRKLRIALLFIQAIFLLIAENQILGSPRHLNILDNEEHRNADIEEIDFF